MDWLPGLLCCVGCIAMLATGARQQRLGDLAAKTGMAQAAAAPALSGRAVAAVVSALRPLWWPGRSPTSRPTDEDEGAQTYRGMVSRLPTQRDLT